jgi:TfdA family taurine catabolism dioxygenase TauD
MLAFSELGQVEDALQPALSTISLDAPSSEKLRAKLNLALKGANRSPSVLQAQLCMRQESRVIAREVFGDPQLSRVREQLASGGIVIWNGLPISDRPSVAAVGDLLSFGQALAAVIAQGTADSFGFLQEDGGLHFQRLFPVAGLVHCGKTLDPLLPHLDNAMLIPSAQPELIHLVCVNNDAQAATIFFSIDAVLRGLREGYDASLIDRLFELAFVTALSNSFVADPSAKAITTRPRPILYPRPEEGGPMRFLGKGYDMGVAPELDNRAEYERALAAYQYVLKERQDLAFSIMARPGQAVSFNQQALLHGRGPIVEGKYREMVRAYGRFDFSELKARLGQLPSDFVFDGIQLVDR